MSTENDQLTPRTLTKAMLERMIRPRKDPKFPPGYAVLHIPGPAFSVGGGEDMGQWREFHRRWLDYHYHRVGTEWIARDSETGRTVVDSGEFVLATGVNECDAGKMIEATFGEPYNQRSGLFFVPGGKIVSFSENNPPEVLVQEASLDDIAVCWANQQFSARRKRDQVDPGSIRIWQKATSSIEAMTIDAVKRHALADTADADRAEAQYWAEKISKVRLDNKR